MKTIFINLRYWTIRLFYLILILLLAFGYYFFSNQQIEIANYSFKNELYKYMEQLPKWLYTVDYFILIFTVAIAIIASLIAFYNISKGKRKETKNNFFRYDVTELFNYLFTIEDLTEDEKKNRVRKFRKNLKTDHSKKLFINTLANIHSQTQGIIQERVATLFSQFNYDYLIFAHLHSPYFRHKIFALKIISEFKLKGYDKYILKLTKRRNNVLHSEAIVTLLKLGIYSDLAFLSDLKLKLTLWDINVIVKTIEESENKDLNYKFLLDSSIPETSTLGIIFIRLHNKIEFKDDVLLKLGHPNDLINEEAFSTYISFARNQADYNLLIDKFTLAPPKAQIKIIQLMKESSDEEKTIQFLNWVVENMPFTQKIEAIRLLLDIDYNIVTKYKQSEDEIIRQSCLHVLDINL